MNRYIAAAFVVLSSVSVLGVTAQPASTPASAEKYALKYKFTPGVEWRYSISGSMESKAPAANPAAGPKNVSVAGDEIITAIAVALDTGIATATCSMNLELKLADAKEGQQESQKQTALGIAEFDSAGKHMGKAEDKNDMLVRLRDSALAGLMPKLKLGFILPEDAIAVGDTWQTSGPLTSLLPLDCSATSTLSEIKTIDGHKCAVISFKIDGANDDRLKQAMSISGNGETVFDLDDGVVKSWKMDVEFGMRKQAGRSMSLKSALVSSDKLAPAKMDEMKKVANALAKAVEQFNAKQNDEALETLATAENAATDETIKACLNGTVANARQFVSVSKNMAEQAKLANDPNSPTGMLKAAAEARARKDWAGAVAKYRELAEKHPDSPMAPMALKVAAQITKEQLNDEKGAEELTKQAEALSAKQHPAAPPAVK